MNYYLSYFTNREKINIKKFVYEIQILNLIEDISLKFYEKFIEQCEIFLDEE